MRHLAALFLLLCSTCALAQTYDCYYGSAQQGGSVVTVNGIQSAQSVQQSFPSATVSVFDHGTTNLSTIYSSQNGTAQVNPFTASSKGVAFWCAGNGVYDVQYSGTGITTPFTVTSIHLCYNCKATAAGAAQGDIPAWDVASSSYLPSSVLASGAGLTADTINLSVNGTFTNTQMNLYVQSLLNGCNPATEIGANANSTSAITGCVAVPLGTVNNHSSGIEGYANSSADSGSGTHGNAVGGYFVGRTVANNSAAWGINPICTDAPHPSGAPTGTWCTAGEFDLGIDGTPAFARGITINAGGAGTAPAGSAYLSAHYTSGNFKLVNGFLIDRGATGSGIGILLDGSGFGGSNISQYIAFNGYDAGNVVHQGNVGVDANGNIRLQPSAGTATLINNNAGVATPSVDYTEVTSPSGLAGSERCYGDSTAHALKCSYNNGSFFTVPLVGIANTWTAANSFSQQVTSTLATGTAPFSIASTTPVANLTTVPATYDAAGTQQTGVHLVKDTCTLGTSCAITLAGSAVFTSGTSYDCWARDATTAANAVTVTRTSGTALAFTGTGTDVINYVCIGN